MTEIGTDRQVVDDVATACFDAPPVISGGLRWPAHRGTLGRDRDRPAPDRHARDLGLVAKPAVLQHLSVVFETAGLGEGIVTADWQAVFSVT